MIRHTNIRSVDIYDFPIMATAIMEEVHILITENLRNFALPTGYILIMNMEQAKKSDLEELVEHLFDK